MSTILFLVSAGYIFAKSGLMTTIVYSLLYFFAMFGFCQIVGSIQNRHLRSARMTFATILIWTILLAISYLIIARFFPSMITIYYIALGVGFITSITSGHIQ